MSSGLASELGYEHGRGTALQRGFRRLAGTRVGAAMLSRTLPRADTVIGRVTSGRQSAPGLFTGISVLRVTTTGRRSGTPRASHLVATPYGPALALIGTNFGQSATPAWVLNLEADPRAVVTFRGVSRDVVARPAAPAEVDEVFARAALFYPGYGRYRQRLEGRRRIRVFVLEPTDEAAGGAAAPPVSAPARWSAGP